MVWMGRRFDSGGGLHHKPAGQAGSNNLFHALELPDGRGVALSAAGTPWTRRYRRDIGSSRLGRDTVASASRNAARDVMPSFGKIR